MKNFVEPLRVNGARVFQPVPSLRGTDWKNRIPSGHPVNEERPMKNVSDPHSIPAGRCGGVLLAACCVSLFIPRSTFAQAQVRRPESAPSIPNPPVGTYQLMLDSKENGVTTLYVLDTATGEIYKKTVDADSWSSEQPIPSLAERRERRKALSATREADRERSIIAEKKKQEKRDAFTKWFRDKTLEEQVKAAETIYVFKCVVVENSHTLVKGQVEPAKAFQMVEYLKSSSNRIMESHLPPPFYPPVGGFVDMTSSFNAQNRSEGEMLVRFAVRGEPQKPRLDFTFAKETEERSYETESSPSFHSSQQSVYTIVLPVPREPEEFIADIKAILAKEKEEERDAQED